MKKARGLFALLIYILSTLIASILILLIINLFWVKQTLFNPDFYEKIFDDNSIYKETDIYLKETVNGVIDYIRVTVSDYEKITEQDKELLSTLQSLSQNTINESMIKDNLTGITNGLINYVKGRQNHLPDINYTINPTDFDKLYIYISQLMLTPNRNTSLYQNNTSSLFEAATSNKLNLGLLLMYFPDYHIDDYLKIVKTLYFTTDNLLLILLCILLVLFFAFIAINKRLMKALRWFTISTVLSSFVGGGFAIYLYMSITNYTGLLIKSTSNFTRVLENVVNDCILTFLWLSIITYIILLSSMLFVEILPKIVFRLKKNNKTTVNEIEVKSSEYINKLFKPNIIIIRGLCFTLILFLSIFGSNRASTLITTISKTDISVLSPTITTSVSYKVVDADKDTLYTLNVVIKDSLTNAPIKGVRYKITSINNNDSEKVIEEILISDDNGMSSVPLHKGYFKLVFDEEFFPADYNLPESLYFNLERSGQATLKVNLIPIYNQENIREANSTFLKVLLIDSLNKPIQGITLKAEKTCELNKTKNKNENSEIALLSISNTEGNAVFNLSSEDYTISFVEENFPSKYILPSPIYLNSNSAKNNTEIVVQMVEKLTN